MKTYARIITALFLACLAGWLSGTPVNLLQNADFSQVGEDSQPSHWFFDNCSSSSMLVHFGRPVDGNPAACIAVDDGDSVELYGYWGQSVTLPAPGKYRLSFRLRNADMQFAYWLSNRNGDVTILKVNAPCNQEEESVLLDFISLQDLQCFIGQEWRTFSTTVNIPKIDGDGFFCIKIGAMAASKGWMAIDDVFFGLEP